MMLLIYIIYFDTIEFKLFILDSNHMYGHACLVTTLLAIKIILSKHIFYLNLAQFPI